MRGSCTMRTRQAGQHLNKWRQWMRNLRRFPWWLRLIIAIIAIVAIIVAVHTYMQNNNVLSNEPATNNQFIISIVVGVLGIAITILQYFLPLSISKVEPANSPLQPTPRQDSLSDSQLIWHMPYQSNPFFTTSGRDALKELHDKFQASETAPLMQPKVISGMSGIGKTQVAVEYAYRYHNEYKAV